RGSHTFSDFCQLTSFEQFGNFSVKFSGISSSSINGYSFNSLVVRGTGCFEEVRINFTNGKNFACSQSFKSLSSALTREHSVRSIHRVESFFSTRCNRVFTVNCTQGKYLASRV